MLNRGKRFGQYQSLVDHRCSRSGYDSDHLVADHGNRTRLGGERIRSVNELHDLSDHLRTRPWFCTHRPSALVPEREALPGLTTDLGLNLKHPVAWRPDVARIGVN